MRLKDTNKIIIEDSELKPFQKFCCQYFKGMLDGKLDEIKLLEKSISGNSKIVIVVRQRRHRSTKSSFIAKALQRIIG